MSIVTGLNDCLKTLNMLHWRDPYKATFSM